MFRAYDTTTEWMGPARATWAEALADVEAHNDGCDEHGGYGSAIVCERDGDYLAVRTPDDELLPMWPPHGKSCGAVRWVE